MIKYYISRRSIMMLIGFLALISCSPLRIGQNSPVVKQLSVDSSLDPYKDSAFVNMVDRYKVGLDSIMDRVVGYCDQPMIAKKPESLLTNYIADLYLELGRDYCRKHNLDFHIDLSVMNVHGLRTSIPQGPVTVRRIYKLMPFENRLIIVSLRGDKLKELLDHIANVGGEGVAGMRMGIRDGKAVDVHIGGVPINYEKQYHIVSIDYLINGGDGMKAFANYHKYIDMNMKCREAIMDYVSDSYQKGIHLTSELDGRIYNEK